MSAKVPRGTLKVELDPLEPPLPHGRRSHCRRLGSRHLLRGSEGDKVDCQLHDLGPQASTGPDRRMPPFADSTPLSAIAVRAFRSLSFGV